jgi:hypothetical protein
VPRSCWAALLAHPNVLADPDVLAAPDVLDVVSMTIRKDLDQIVGAYLALPAHLRHRPIPTGGRTSTSNGATGTRHRSSSAAPKSCRRRSTVRGARKSLA